MDLKVALAIQTAVFVLLAVAAPFLSGVAEIAVIGMTAMYMCGFLYAVIKHERAATIDATIIALRAIVTKTAPDPCPKKPVCVVVREATKYQRP